MKLVSFGPAGEEKPGVVVGDTVVDLGAVSSSLPATVRDILQKEVLDEVRGLEGPPPIVAAGANTADPAYVPSPQKWSPIKEGDLVVIDLSARVAGAERSIYARLGWVAFVGDAVPEKFAQSFAQRLEPGLTGAGVPAQQAAMVAAFATEGGRDLTQVGGASLSEQLAQVPPLQGIVDQVVAGIYDAFSLAIADTFWFGLVVTMVALVVVTVGLRDVPLPGLASATAGRAAPGGETAIPLTGSDAGGSPVA